MRFEKKKTKENWFKVLRVDKYRALLSHIFIFSIIVYEFQNVRYLIAQQMDNITIIPMVNESDVYMYESIFQFIQMNDEKNRLTLTHYHC